MEQNVTLKVKYQDQSANTHHNIIYHEEQNVITLKVKCEDHSQMHLYHSMFQTIGRME